MTKLKTKPAYKIFVMDSDEFNDLHKYIPEVKKKDLEEGLGFANPKTKECYIKRTGVKEWDDETIIHEAEELLAKHSSHEDEQNIRWKRGGSIIRNIVSAIVAPFAPPLAMAMQLGHGLYEQSKGRQTTGQTLLGTALTGIGGAMGSAGAKAGVAASKAAGGGILGQTLTGLKGAIGVSPKFTPPSTMGAPSSAIGSLGSGFAKTQVGGTPVSFGGAPYNIMGKAGSLTAAPAVSSAMAGIPSAYSNVAGSVLPTPKISTTPPSFSTPSVTPRVPTTPATPQLPSVPKPGGITTETPSLMEGIKEKAGEFIKSPTNVLGLASMGSSMLPKTPQFEMPSYVSDLRTKLMEGEALSPLGQQARSSLSEILGSEPTELYPTANDEYYEAALRRTRESYAEAGKRLDAQYNLVGTFGSGEHMAQKAKLQEELARTESALYSQTEQRRFELARTTQYQAIQDSLGVDREVMDDLVGLTGLDVTTAAMIYGAQVEDVKAIRENLGTMGMELMSRGKVKSGGGININFGQ